MNSTSLAYVFNKNQDKKSSWNDDPFDLNGVFTGGYNLSNDRNLKNYALDLAYSYAELSSDNYELLLEDLSYDSQLELSRLYIESIDREIEWACYGKDESINSDFLCALLSMLKNNCQKTRENFAKITSRNILIYYKDTLQRVLDEACDEYSSYVSNSSYFDQGYCGEEE